MELANVGHCSFTMMYYKTSLYKLSVSKSHHMCKKVIYKVVDWWHRSP